MIEITDEIVTKAAMSDAEFDGRPWASLGRGDRERYMARARASVGAVAPMIAAAEIAACVALADAVVAYVRGTEPDYQKRTADALRKIGAMDPAFFKVAESLTSAAFEMSVAAAEGVRDMLIDRGSK